MAEKGFGVKEINLIGPSGTPTITSPNNLNLNANNVAISTNVSIGGTLSVTGNVSVGGTLTYEDVTNIDSVGLITARSGIHINNEAISGIGITINMSGINVSSGIITAPSFRAPYNGGFSMTQGQYNNGYYINSTGGNTLIGMAYYSNNTIGLGGNGSSLIPFKIDDVSQITLSPNTGNVALAYAGNTKLSTTNTGVNVTGAITVNGSALSIDPTNSDIQVAYTVTANGSSAYRFAGNGVVSTADNPDLYLIRGQKYRFINNSGGSHPFQIREASGGTAYSTGVTNNGASSGNIDFAPTYDSPAQLVYQCTSHGGMVGNIYIRGANGANNNVGVTTFTGSQGIHLKSGVPAIFLEDTDGTHGQAIIEQNSDDLKIRQDAGNASSGTGSNIKFEIDASEKFRIESTGNLLLQPSNPGSSLFYPYMNVLNGQIKKYMQVKILNSGQGTKFTFTGTDRTSALITIKVSHSWTASNTSNRHGSAIYAVRIFTANGGSAGWDGITLIQAYGYSTGNFILSNESGYGYSITVNNPLSDSGISFCYDIEVMSASNTSKHSLTSVTVV